MLSFLDDHSKKAFALLGCCFFVYLFFAFAGQSRSPYVHTRWLSQPVANDDYIQHYAHAVNSARSLQAHGRTWQYSARHHAGYPADPFHLSNQWAIFFVVLLGGATGAAFAFNLAVFTAYLLSPLFAFLAARNLHLRPAGALLFSLLSMFLIVGEEHAHAGFRNFFGYGMYGWTLGVFLSIYVWSLLHDYLNTRSRGALIKGAVFGALALLVHPLSAVLCAVLALFLLASHRRSLRAADSWRLGAVGLFIVLTNAIWWYPLWRFSALNRAFDDHLQTSLRTARDWVGAPLFLVILVLFAYAAWLLWREGKRQLCVTFVGPFVVLLGLAALGTQVGAGFMQPLRLSSPLCVLACLLICMATPRELRAKNILFVAALVAIFAQLCTSPSSLRLRYGYDVDANPEVHKILAFIRDETTARARLHVQDQRKGEHLPQTHPFLPGFKTRFIAYLPGATGREVVSGPYNRPEAFQFTQFGRAS
jgi:hypothetical protein